MSKVRVVYTGPNGNTCVCSVVQTPGKGGVPFLEGETEEEHALRVAKRDAPSGSKNFVVCPKELVPMDRTFRNAWKRDMTDSPDPIEIDMRKARDIHLNRCRRHRNEILKKLDLEAMRAIEDNDHEALIAIKDRKAKLRDMPKRVKRKLAECNCPVELKSWMPDELLDEGVEEIEPLGGDENPNN